MTEFAQRIFADLESRQREDRRDVAEKNLEWIEKALRWLWDYLPPEVMDDPLSHFDDENLFHFLMQTEDELNPFFHEIREAIRD